MRHGASHFRNRIAEGLVRWLKTLEMSISALSAAQNKVADAELILAKNGAQLAALRALSQRISIGQETVDAALELLWAEESRLSDELCTLFSISLGRRMLLIFPCVHIKANL